MKKSILVFVLIASLLAVSYTLRLKASNRTNLRDAEEDEIKQILKEDYPKFISKLGERIKDVKFRAAIRELAKKGKVNSNTISISAKNLTPTQNEIDMNKSLLYLLTDLKTANIILNCRRENPIKIADKPIVTSSNGEYIIDGHHRWSQVICGNRKCKMEAIDLTDLDDPIQALKITQLGIAASVDKDGKEITSIPQEVVKGKNLFKVTKEEICKFVDDKIIPEVIELFQQFDSNLTEKHKICDYLWNNISKLQNKHQPVINAPSRSIMPQTGIAVNWQDNSVKLS